MTLISIKPAVLKILVFLKNFAAAQSRFDNRAREMIVKSFKTMIFYLVRSRNIDLI